MKKVLLVCLFALLFSCEPGESTYTATHEASASVSKSRIRLIDRGIINGNTVSILCIDGYKFVMADFQEAISITQFYIQPQMSSMVVVAKCGD